MDLLSPHPLQDDTATRPGHSSRFGRVTDPTSMASTSPPASAPGLLLDWRPPTAIKKHMIPKVVDAASAVDLFRKSDSKNLVAFDQGWDIDLVHIELCKITAIWTAVRSDGPFLNEMNPTIRREERGVPSLPLPSHFATTDTKPIKHIKTPRNFQPPESHKSMFLAHRDGRSSLTLRALDGAKLRR